MNTKYSKILEALRAKYDAEVKAAEANLEIYLTNSVGIGEHRDMVAECDALVAQITDAKEKLTTVERLIETGV